MENLIIEPLKGYGDIKFGMSIDEVVNVFGTPSNLEELEPIIEGNEITSVLYDYEDLAVSICFEGTDKMLVSSISTISEDATLFGEKIYNMNRNQIIDLMKKNGYKEFDEEEQEGDTCLIYDELMLDFYFNEGELIDVVWGVVS
ncbi:MAG: hypothetical protein J6U85_00535 [Bacteroidales bacterium]|nr:hypothetical protein [Bacteroidales bacterium]